MWICIWYYTLDISTHCEVNDYMLLHWHYMVSPSSPLSLHMSHCLCCWTLSRDVRFMDPEAIHCWSNSNFLLGQKFVALEFKFEFCKGRPPLAMPNSTNIPVSHIILYELSDCILYRQTNGTLWINYSMFFWKISSKKSTFLRFTHQNLLTPSPP